MMIDIFTVRLNSFTRDGGFEDSGIFHDPAEFLLEEKAIEWANKHVPSSTRDYLGVATVYVGDQYYDMYTVTSADR